MRISATVRNTPETHEAFVRTEGHVQRLQIPAKDAGRGSSVNGGEFLMLALATCYCNDIFREAGIRGIDIIDIEVEANGDFGAAGTPATTIEYRANVTANAPDEVIKDLIRHTDSVAEVHLTIRRGLDVTLIE